jgi:hypothetical protein
MARELLALRADGWRPMSAHDGSTDEVLLWWPYWSNQPTVGHLKHGRWIAENALNEWPTTRDNDYPGPQAFRPLPAPPAEERRQLVTIEEVSGCVDELTGGKSLREHMNKLRGDE